MTPPNPFRDSRTSQPSARAGHRSLVDLEHAGTRSVSPAGLPALAADGAQPGPDAAPGFARDGGAGVERRALPRCLRRRGRRTRRRARGGRHLVAAPVSGGERHHCLFFRRVRAASVAADLCRRPWRPGRRSLQRSERSRHTADRCRFHVSAGLLPPDRFPRKAGSRSSTSVSTGRMRRSNRQLPPTANRASSPCRSATAACSCPSGAFASDASSCICSTPTSRRTRRGIASCRRGSTAATVKRESSRKSSWESAAFAR